jgi:hypothetical protein
MAMDLFIFVLGYGEVWGLLHIPIQLMV